MSRALRIPAHGRMARSARLFPLLVAVPAALVLAGLAVGLKLRPAPKPAPPMFPTYAQVTASAGVLVHQLESVNFLSLAASPDFIGCDHTQHQGVRCVYQVTFADETSAYYGIWLNRANEPTLGRKLKGLPTPQPA